MGKQSDAYKVFLANRFIRKEAERVNADPDNPFVEASFDERTFTQALQATTPFVGNTLSGTTFSPRAGDAVSGEVLSEFVSFIDIIERVDQAQLASGSRIGSDFDQLGFPKLVSQLKQGEFGGINSLLAFVNFPGNALGGLSDEFLFAVNAAGIERDPGSLNNLYAALLSSQKGNADLLAFQNLGDDFGFGIQSGVILSNASIESLGFGSVKAIADAAAATQGEPDSDDFDDTLDILRGEAGEAGVQRNFRSRLGRGRGSTILGGGLGDATILGGNDRA
jgi:hypothetical protein